MNTEDKIKEVSNKFEVVIDFLRNKKTITLGTGDKVVTTILAKDGKSAGFRVGHLPEIYDIGVNLNGEIADDRIEYLVNIVATDTKSLDVIIESCERAKKFLEESND